jgi:tetratricopeptide (TPR) repeat protein
LQEIIGECRERIAGEDPRPELYLSLVAALRRESLKDSLEEIEGALRAVCDLQPDSHECRDQFGRFYLDINQPTQAMDQFLKAVRLGSRSEFVLYQLTRLAPHLMEYVSEFGVETLVEALPALRFAIHDTGYQKEDVRFFRSCALILGKPEDSLPVLAGRVNTCFKAAHSISDAFISGSAARSEYLHALSDLLRAQVEVGQIREARETFKRIRNHAGARKQINTFLPSLRHLPYREDLSAFYSEVLGEFSGWSGGHVELAEYLYRAGHYDQASDQIVKAAACCYDFPTLLGDLAAMPNLATHQRWPEILEVMTRRRAELRALRR